MIRSIYQTKSLPVILPSMNMGLYPSGSFLPGITKTDSACSREKDVGGVDVLDNWRIKALRRVPENLERFHLYS
jgi:hypothetical protein